ncbi:MAG: HEAT repeat domain-containing protein [Deltaproteobacteria bacterium]|nr:HEAT repeat domain-containing protein [Deltaproteobacteria bacterium]
MNTLADQVVEFTISLVRALHRVGQFDPAKANFPRVRARLWKELGRLQRTQPEIGYVVGPPAVVGGPPETWVDGTSPQRVELRRIVGPSVGGAFVLQLLEFMQHRGLLALAFLRGLTEPEWNDFLEIASAPSVGKNPADEGRRLARAVLDKKITHVAVVCDAEQPQVQPEIPWQVRTAYARLLRDLRAEVGTGPVSPQKLLEQSERFATGMGYSYFRKFDVLKAMLFHIQIVDKLLHENPAMRQVHALDILVHGLPVLSLHGTTNLIFKESGSATEPPPEPAAQVLRAIAERLLTMPPSRQVDETLRAMCRRRIVPIARLPVDLQEWVLAETWVETLRANSGAEPPRGSAESKPVRILQKAARYAFTQHLPVQATGILERIKTVDAKAVPAVFDVPTVEAVLAEFPEGANEKRGLLALLQQGGDSAADSTASVLVTAEHKVREEALWILTQMKEAGVAAALRALDQDIESEEAAHLLLTCATGKAPESAAAAFIRQLKHKSPRVRRDALTALASANQAAANPHVAEALADSDESVRIRALLLCAASGVGDEQVIPRAIQIVSKDARGAPPQVVRAAIEVVIRRREAGALPLPDAQEALCRLATPIGFFGRLFGQTTQPAAVLVTAIGAIGRLGTDRAKNLLVRLGHSKDPDVAQAAQRELEHKGTRSPLSPMSSLDVAGRKSFSGD